MLFRVISLILFLSSINAYAYAFDINSFASGVQQKNSPEQWIQKNQIPNYDESRLSNPQSLEDSAAAQKFMDLAAQMTSSQYSYTCSMIRKVEDKSFFKCEADGSIYNSMQLCTANCNSIYACQQEQCIYANMCAQSQTCPLGDYQCINNSCAQNGTCSSSQVQTTQYQCPTTGTIYSDQTTCNNNCIQTANCTSSTNDYVVTSGYQCSCEYSISPPGSTECSWYPHPDCNSGDQLIGCGMENCVNGDGVTCWPGQTFTAAYCRHTTYTCPLTGGSACSGSPASCTKGATCTTQSVTTTKYQCSLTGTQYDTDSQCASNCVNTASCNTNYECTYENSIYSDVSTCQANCSFYRCPSDGANYLTASDCQNACGSFVCQKDNSKFNNIYDCQNNCKEPASCTAQ